MLDRVLENCTNKYTIAFSNNVLLNIEFTVFVYIFVTMITLLKTNVDVGMKQ